MRLMLTGQLSNVVWHEENWSFILLWQAIVLEYSEWAHYYAMRVLAFEALNEPA